MFFSNIYENMEYCLLNFPHYPRFSVFTKNRVWMSVSKLIFKKTLCWVDCHSRTRLQRSREKPGENDINSQEYIKKMMYFMS